MSLFSNAFDTTPLPETVCLEDFFLGIKNGRWDGEVAQARAGGTEGAEWKERKRALPAVTMSGSFESRNAKALIEHSEWLQIDLDAKGNLGVDWEDMRRRLINDPYVGAGATGPSGTGLKLGLRIDPANHSASFVEAERYFRDEYGLKIDPACCDPARLCFVSHDPKAWLHTERETQILPLPADARPGVWTKVSGSGDTAPSVSFESPEEEEAVVREVREMISFIPTRPDYPKWLRILSGVFSVLPFDSGFEVLDEWSPEEQDGEYKEKFKYRLKDVGLGTVAMFAKEGGYDTSPEARARRAAKGFSALAVPYKEGEARNIVVLPGDVSNAVESSDFVEGLLTDGAMSVVYGQSNVGKSFWAFDLGVHVARGMRWRNGEVGVEGGSVLYFALEGSQGALGRVLALRKDGLLAQGDPFGLCFCKVDLLHERGTDCIIQAIQEVERRTGKPIRLIILDTLSRALGGGNENDNDMTKAVLAVDAIRAKSGAHIMLIHHSGKDESRGARGHSSLRGATDTEIELFSVGCSEVITAVVKKQRDLPQRGPMPFRLEVVEIATGRRGTPITSCVCVHLPPDKALQRSGKARKTKFRLRPILELLPQESVTAWGEAAQEQLGVPRTTFQRYIHGAGAKGRWELTENGAANPCFPEFEDISGDD